MVSAQNALRAGDVAQLAECLLSLQEPPEPHKPPWWHTAESQNAGKEDSGIRSSGHPHF